MTIVSVYAVFADAEEAERIGLTVIEERLAACINVLAPCRSIFRWEGKIETAEEVPAILKTHLDRVDGLIERIAELHSYEVPCVAVWPVANILRGYGQWVGEEVSARA